METRNTRIKYEITCSISTQSTDAQVRGFNRFCKAVEGKVSRITGGCTVLHGDGYWSEEGEATKSEYSRINREISHTIVVTHDRLINAELKQAYREAKEYIPEAQVEWIDFRFYNVETNHFKI